MKSTLIENLEKAKDFNINTVSIPELTKQYQDWIDQVNSENIIDINLAIWIEHQYHYWNTKNRQYGNFLKTFLENQGLAIS